MEKNKQLKINREEDVKTIIKHGTELNLLSFKGFSAIEMNLFYTIIYKIKNIGTKTICINFEEIRKLSNYDEKDRHTERFTSYLENVNDKLFDVRGRIVDDDGNIEKFVLFTKYKIWNTVEIPYIEIQINKEYEYLFNQLTQYTSFDLLEYINIKSTYAKKIFTLIKQFEKTGWYEVNYQEFKDLLGIPSSYYPKDIERQILIPVEKELGAYFKKFKYIKRVLRKKLESIRFTWDITKPVVEVYEKPVNPKVTNTSSKFKKELPVVNRATEKATIEHFQKQEENEILSIEKNKEINELFNKISSLPLEIQTILSEKAYDSLLKKSDSPNSKIMQGIFEKSKKSLIVEEYKKYLEEQEPTSEIKSQSMNLKVKSKKEKQLTLETIEQQSQIRMVNMTNTEKEMTEFLADLGVNPYTVNEHSYDTFYKDYLRDIDHSLGKFEGDRRFDNNENRELIVDRFIKINDEYNRTYLLENFDEPRVRELLNPYIAKIVSDHFRKGQKEQIFLQPKTKLYTLETIPNELLLDKRGRKLVGSALDSRIDKILKEQENYLKKLDVF